jgi:hypothetical protein
MKQSRDEVRFGQGSRQFEEVPGRRGVNPKSRFYLGLAIFTSAPVAWVLQIGKGDWKALLLASGILGLAGAVAYLMLHGFLRVVRNGLKGAPKIPLEAGERVIHSAPANHYKGLVSEGGELRITSDRLLFRPHGFNWTVEPVIIRWSEVEGIAFDESVDFILLKAAASLASHMHVDSKLLRVRHGAVESRFVVTLTPALVKSVAEAASKASAEVSLSAP